MLAAAMPIAMNLAFDIIPVTPFAQNTSLVWDTTTMRGALVDPGGEIERLMAAVARRGVTVEKILVTHGHLDHVGAVGELAEKLAVPIEGPQREDAFWIDQLPAQAQMFGFPPARRFTPDRWLEHGDTVQVGTLDFEVLHCPGHTPGHVVFFNRTAQLVFVGDVIFQGSIGRTDFPRGNHVDLIRSIRQRLFALGDDVRFVPGHGPMSTFAAERRHNPFVSDRAVGVA
jgi:glyoxylase-like metal-dependent hydrolase (beta-lactamase superfamily II)